jgi:hypothetical protein
MTPNDSDGQMVVVLEKEDSPDMSFEQGVFDEFGIRVENAIPHEELKALANEWEQSKFYGAGEDYAQELRDVIKNHDG